MPERHSTPGGATAEQDADQRLATDHAPGHPADIADEPTWPVTRRTAAAGDGLPRATAPTPARSPLPSAPPPPTSTSALSGNRTAPAGGGPTPSAGDLPASASAPLSSAGDLPPSPSAPAATRPASSAGDPPPSSSATLPSMGDLPASMSDPAGDRPAGGDVTGLPAADSERMDDVDTHSAEPSVGGNPDAETTYVLPAPDVPTVQIAARPGVGAPEAPTVAQSASAQSGSAQSGSAQSGSAQSGSAQSGSAQSGSAQSGSAQSAAAQPEAPIAAEPAEPTAGPAVKPRRRRRILLVTGGVVAVLGLLYGGDLVLSSGSVPRGVTVEGVPVGGLAVADAEPTLRAQIEPRTTHPVPVTVGDATSTIDPTTAGLSIDWTATLAQAEHQPLDPVTRIASFFTTREIGVVTKSDPAALEAALTELKPAVDKPPVEGNVRFDDTTPQPVEPAAGQQLDVPAAASVLARDWASGRPVGLPLTRLDPTTTRDDVTAALEKIAKPAVSAPITITGENGTSATLSPQNIAAALRFRADSAAGLVPELNQNAITTVLRPQLADSETPGRDATLDFTGSTPVVRPSQDGRGVDYPATLKALLPVLTATAPRQVAAVYAEQPAKLTTEALSKLGISGIIGEFSTRGFAADSGMNIKRAAEQINGTIVQPGDTFSLNAVTNPRDAAHGYVEAGIIEDGHPARGVGGGVSQVATTLYNAAYFAGMTNVEHKEHSYYIGRYPAGREATVFDNLIDLKFRNDNPAAIMIQTAWTPSTITVRIYGTKHYDVTSATGPRTNPTEPKTVTIPDDEPCMPSKGAPGFTVTDTRTLKEISTGQVRTETRTVRYNPSPTIECGDD